LEDAVSNVLRAQPKAVADYHLGKGNSLQFLLGQVLRVVGRQVEVGKVIAELKTQLNRS